mgnify:CR=1 FL=1
MHPRVHPYHAFDRFLILRNAATNRMSDVPFHATEELPFFRCLIVPVVFATKKGMRLVIVTLRYLQNYALLQSVPRFCHVFIRTRQFHVVNVHNEQQLPFLMEIDTRPIIRDRLEARFPARLITKFLPKGT